jgi:hypothetical protein
MRLAPEVDRKPLFEALDYTPRTEQWAIHNSESRFIVPCCGRRFGKSLCAGNELTAYMFTPDSRYWIVGPTYRLGEKEFRVVLHNLVQKLKIPKLRFSNNVKQGDMRITMPAPWNTVLEVVSADRPDSLVGEGLNGVIMSEAALHKASTWEMFIEPALSDERGFAIFPSTPRGFNWFQGMWQLGQMPEMDDYDSWQLPTWSNTNKFPGGRFDPEILRIESTVSKQHFKQEYSAEFTAFEGKIYDEFNFRDHVKQIEYNPAWQNYWAMDFGYVDPFVVLDIMVDSSDNVYVWREYQVSGISTYEHGKALLQRQNPEGFHVDGMYGDPRGADERATLALTLGHIQANAVGWSLGVEAIRQALKLRPDGTPGLFIDPSCVNLTRQMDQLRFAEVREGHNAQGRTGVEKQHDHDDHGPDALRYFFNEHVVLRAGAGSLADVYSGKRRTEAATFFQNRMNVTLDKRMSF